MFSFFKKKTDETVVPEWAVFFNKQEYSTFISEVSNYFNSSANKFKIDDGFVILDSKEFGYSQMGLINVAQVCKQHKKRDYRSIIIDHFDRLKRSYKFEHEFKQKAIDFDKIEEFLGLRLYSNDYVNFIGKDATIGFNVFADVYAMLVFDLPETIINVKPEQASIWNLPIEELLNIGKKNSHDLYPVNIVEKKLNNEKIWLVKADHFYTGNVIFEIGNIPELTGKFGCLVAIPHRHTVLIYPINNIHVINVLNNFIPIAKGMFDEGPGAISSEISWFYNGEFIHIPTEMEGEKFNIFPPEKFSEIINQLSNK